MSTVAILKNTNQETVVKVYGTGSSEILLNDLTAGTQVVDSATDQTVNIMGVNWTGTTGSTVTISRDGELVLPIVAEGAQNLDFVGQGYCDNTFNTSSIVVDIQGADAAVYLILRKVEGWKTKVEYASYGSYDDETVVGPNIKSGAPAPEGLFDLPLVGSGSYETTLAVDTSVAGTPYPPGGEIATLDNATAGLYRVKFVGNFAPNVGDEIDTYFCQDNPYYFGQADTFVGFGQQDLATENYYTLEWTGYFKPPTTGNYNFWAKSDDDLYMWIGPNAVSGNESSANHVVSSSNTTGQTADSLYLEADKYYPVRLQFGEWGGSEKAQIFWAKEGDDNAKSGNQEAVWFHDSVDPRTL